MRSSSFLSFIAVFAAHYPVVNAAAIAPAEIDGNETSTLVARDDGFKYSCDGIGFVPQFRSLLFATCRRADGTVGGNTQINLDKCVGNNDGQLVAQANGGLWGSCDKDSCSVWNAILKCNCRKYGGEWESSVLDLNWFMGNDNGALTCFGLKGL